MQKYILAIDQGTTSSRSIIFDHSGNIKTTAQKEFNQIYPQPGWVEHDAMEIWSSQASVISEAIINAGLKPIDIAGIGVTNQRETSIIWDKETGIPIYNAIVWQDRRTSEYCNSLKEDGHEQSIRDKTGLIIDAYFSATKIKWILDHVPGARDKAATNKLAFGTVDSWIIWNLTGGKAHVTDVSNASRTMIYNINTLQWDEDLLKLFDVPISILPEVRSSSEIYGTTTGNFLAHKIPIAGIAGDQQAALFGQMCITPGMVKNTYGTGCFMLMNIGDKPIITTHKLITTIAWQINGATQYALEGSIFIGGAVVQWLRDGLGIISSASDVEALASKVSDSGGVTIVPAFAGLGAPHWNQEARGTIVGITRGTTSAHIAYAALESICFQTMDVLNAMQADASTKIKELRVDGGASINNMLMQMQADILHTNVVRPVITETTALGAAYLAGLAVGFWKDIDELSSQWQKDRLFVPQIQNPEQRIKKWQKAVRAAIAWTDN